jgi:signal transduction histidine kinase
MLLVDLTLVALSLATAIFLVLWVAVWKSRSTRDTSIWLLAVYLLFSFCWNVINLLGRIQELKWISWFDLFALERISIYLILAFALDFLQLTRNFIRKTGWNTAWWIGGALALVIPIFLYENPLRWPTKIPVGTSFYLLREPIAFWLLVTGWALCLGYALFLSIKNYLQSLSPLHRNRNLYWMIAAGITFAGQILLLLRQYPAGIILQALSLVIASYVQLTHHLPDIRASARHTTSYLAIILLSTVIYSICILVLQLIIRQQAGLRPITAVVMLALGLAVLVNPLLNVLRNTLDRTMKGSHYDPKQTLGEYSMSISNILELDHLAAVVVGAISDAMEVSQGALVTVHNESGNGVFMEDGNSGYRLRIIDGFGAELSNFLLPETEPIAITLRNEHHPLTQYDIDLLSRYKGTSSAVKAWLNDLKMDVFVPIYAKGSWIGLLAVGPKKSGDRYFDEDIATLQILADQTAVALENSRLYEDLKQRTSEIEHLYKELKSANNELARLDEAKSDFINIASHELRTPLTQVIGYNDILGEMIKAQDLDPAIGGQMIDSVRKAARRLEEIVEIMFDVSKLESKTFELNRAQVSLASIISVAINTWAKGLEERKLSISVGDVAGLSLVYGDGKRLIQVFSNLIQNAIKSTPDQGQIQISGRPYRQPGEGSDNEEDWVEVIVADTGIGIARDDLERIFTKFYRVGNVLLHSTGDTKFKGAGPGLGLTISRGIIEAHGGRIWAESPGNNEYDCPGSEFHVVLPVKPPQAYS